MTKKKLCKHKHSLNMHIKLINQGKFKCLIQHKFSGLNKKSRLFGFFFYQTFVLW